MENKNHDADNDFLCAVQLQRIASALEEVLRLVKKDQEESKKRWEKETIGEQKNFQPSDLYKSLALARGQWI